MTVTTTNGHAATVTREDIATAVTSSVHTGQLRIAEAYVKTYAHRCLYVHGLGWHYWTGTHWAEDRDGKTRRRLVQLLKQLRHESVDMDPKDRDALLADVRRCESAGGMSGVLDIARHMHPMTVAAEDINSDPALFNTLNGTLNLETGELQPPNPRDMITKVAGAELHEDAVDAAFDRFLETSLPDEDVRAYLQRVMGLAMFGRVREHVLPILTGTGGNGKSVLVDAVLAAFGSYGLTVDPQLIMKTKHQRHGTFVADLHGARLVVTSETDQGEELAASTVKRLTGGDKLRANRMREDPFEFEPSHTLVYVTNHRPKVDAEDPAMWRRLSVIPFDVTPAQPDVTLPEKLRQRLDAVLAWCYQGWLAYQSQGLNPPAEVAARTDQYRHESDPIAQFLDSECVISPDAKVKAKALYEAWQVWAMRNGEKSKTETAFGTLMAARFKKKRGSSGNVYVGVGLASEDYPT